MNPRYGHDIPKYNVIDTIKQIFQFHK